MSGLKVFDIGLPNPLRNLASRLPGNPSAEQLAYERTFLPYYERFVSQGRVDWLWETLLHGEPNNSSLRSWISRDRRKDLRSCPDCVAEDLGSEIGASGFRRVHQLPGVFVCPVHFTRLRVKISRTSLIPPPEGPDDCGRLNEWLTDAAAISVAGNSLWLLQNPGSPTGADALRYAIGALLREAGWLRDDGLGKGLRREMIDFLGPSLVGYLPFPDSGRDGMKLWLDNLWSADGDFDSRPLSYLLLLAFLGRNVADLFAHAAEAAENCKAQEEDWLGLDRVLHDPRARRIAALIKGHRAKILSVLAERPTSDREEVCKAAPDAVRYLNLMDHSWLVSVLPPEAVRSTRRRITPGRPAAND